MQNQAKTDHAACLSRQKFQAFQFAYLSQDFPTAAVVSCHLLPGVDPLAEHDGAVGAVPQRLEGDVSVHGPHVASPGHQQ